MSEKPMKPSDKALFPDQLLGDIRQMIEEARASVAATVNAGLTMLYWQIGRRISQEILKGERAEYGAEIVSALARQLTSELRAGIFRKESAPH